MLSKTTKNRFAYKLDKVFWFILAIGPFVGYFLVITFSGLAAPTGEIKLSFWNFFSLYLFPMDAFTENIIWSALYNLFGPKGVFPFFTTSSALLVFYWPIIVEIAHVFFDVMVFIPRLAHKWISKAVQDD